MCGSVEFQRKGTAELKERLPVSSLTDGRRRVMTDAERVERLDCSLIQVCLIV